RLRMGARAAGERCRIRRRRRRARVRRRAQYAPARRRRPRLRHESAEQGFPPRQSTRRQHVRMRGFFQREDVRRKMSTSTKVIQDLADRDYRYGFVTDVEQEALPRGLDENVVRLISAKKGEPEWLLEWRLKAYRTWLTMKEPTWANVTYGPIDYQNII